jgi:hypothetical protein
MRVRQLMPLIFFISISCMPHGIAVDTESASTYSNTCADSQPPYKYVGNRYSHKFHLPDCPFAQAMSRWNAEYFRTREEAVEHGEKPCHWCLPLWCKSVSAIIVGSSSNTSNPKNDPSPRSDSNPSESSNLNNSCSLSNMSEVSNTSNIKKSVVGRTSSLK